MQSWSWHPPAFVPCDSVPLSDRGFRYGMAVFESLRVVGGRALLASEHALRLEKACAHRGFPLDATAFSHAITTLQEHGQDGFARIYVTAGDGSVGDPAISPRIFLILESRNRPQFNAYDLALPAGTSQPLFGGLKTANYWSNVDALQRALAQGKQEALLFNEHGELFSACMANVFVYSNGVLKTPPLACGARDGVIRQWVMKKQPVKEVSVFLDDIRMAEEIFLTNSWIGVMPVRSVDSIRIPSESIAQSLRAALDAEIESQIS